MGRIRHVEPFDFGEMLRGLDKMTIEAKLQNLINFFNEIRKSVDELLTKINLLSKELDGVVLKKSDEVGEDVIQRYMTEVTAYTESEIDKR